jgi:TonB family protein
MSMKLSRLGFSWAASCLFHAAMMGGLGWVVASHALSQKSAPIPIPIEEPQAGGEADVDLDLPVAFAGSVVEQGEPDPNGIPPTPAGGETTPRIDTGDYGKGGGPTLDKATHLADRDEASTMTPDLASRLDRDQIQRLKTAQGRASWEDRRATTQPMELTFLAFGTGKVEERRAKAARDPNRGAARSGLASVLGGLPGGTFPDDGDQGARQGAARSGTANASPGAGVRDAREGADHRTSANAMTGKPSVQQASPSIPASDKAKPKDNIDTEQDVSLMVQHIVQATTSGGSPGFGIGGSEGGGAPGAGGKGGAGSHPGPLGPGSIGEWFDLDSKDPRLLPYFRKIKAKVDPLWSFPKSAMLQMKQGVVILEVDIAEDGTATVAWPPLRPSGIEEFDQNCAGAIRKAQPFEPIPQSLGMKKLHIRAPFSSTSGASWAP